MTPGIGTRFGTRGLSIGPHRSRSTTTAEFPAPTGRERFGVPGELNRQVAVTGAVTMLCPSALTYQFVAIYWVSQAQRVLYGRRPLAGVGHGRRSGAERGCTSTSAAEVPAPAVAGLDGPIAAPAPRVDPVRRGPGTRSRSGSGHLGPRPRASRLIAGAGPPRRRRNQSGSWRSSGQCRLAQRGPGPAP